MSAGAPRQAADSPRLEWGYRTGESLESMAMRLSRLEEHQGAIHAVFQETSEALRRGYHPFAVATPPDGPMERPWSSWWSFLEVLQDLWDRAPYQVLRNQPNRVTTVAWRCTREILFKACELAWALLCSEVAKRSHEGGALRGPLAPLLDELLALIGQTGSWDIRWTALSYARDPRQLARNHLPIRRLHAALQEAQLDPSAHVRQAFVEFNFMTLLGLSSTQKMGPQMIHRISAELLHLSAVHRDAAEDAAYSDSWTLVTDGRCFRVTHGQKMPAGYAPVLAMSPIFRELTLVGFGWVAQEIVQMKDSLAHDHHQRQRLRAQEPDATQAIRATECVSVEVSIAIGWNDALQGHYQPALLNLQKSRPASEQGQPRWTCAELDSAARILFQEHSLHVSCHIGQLVAIHLPMQTASALCIVSSIDCRKGATHVGVELVSERFEQGEALSLDVLWSDTKKPTSRLLVLSERDAAPDALTVLVPASSYVHLSLSIPRTIRYMGNVFKRQGKPSRLYGFAIVRFRADRSTRAPLAAA